MPVRFGVVVFPGSNCDHDAYHATKHVLGQEARFLWHEDPSVGDVDVVLLPGGFSYGDHLRSGAIARFSPIMEDVVQFAQDGGLVFGICNGFQILCEAGLLPGTLLRNESLRFVSTPITVRVENTNTAFTNALSPGQTLTVPVAHGEGRYYADDTVLDQLEADDRVLFRYSAPDGTLTDDANPNGSARHIAGVVNEAGNVCGFMPHPERCVESMIEGTDGRLLFESLIEHIRGVHA
ncbi:MAG: phosphoribosylformylglycinamidine synthase subunit PurQ [Salinibacter sp.]